MWVVSNQLCVYAPCVSFFHTFCSCDCHRCSSSVAPLVHGREHMPGLLAACWLHSSTACSFTLVRVHWYMFHFCRLRNTLAACGLLSWHGVLHYASNMYNMYCGSQPYQCHVMSLSKEVGILYDQHASSRCSGAVDAQQPPSALQGACMASGLSADGWCRLHGPVKQSCTCKIPLHIGSSATPSAHQSYAA